MDPLLLFSEKRTVEPSTVSIGFVGKSLDCSASKRLISCWISCLPFLFRLKLPTSGGMNLLVTRLFLFSNSTWASLFMKVKAFRASCPDCKTERPWPEDYKIDGLKSCPMQVSVWFYPFCHENTISELSIPLLKAKMKRHVTRRLEDRWSRIISNASVCMLEPFLLPKYHFRIFHPLLKQLDLHAVICPLSRHFRLKCEWCCSTLFCCVVDPCHGKKLQTI